MFMRCQLEIDAWALGSSTQKAEITHTHPLLRYIMASEQPGQPVSSSATQLTRGRTRKFKTPPSILPQLPLSTLQHRLEASSDQLEQLRSTSKTPRSGSARAGAPHKYDNIMGIGPVSSPSETETGSEKTDQGGRSESHKPLEGSVQTTQNGGSLY